MGFTDLDLAAGPFLVAPPYSDDERLTVQITDEGVIVDLVPNIVDVPEGSGWGDLIDGEQAATATWAASWDNLADLTNDPGPEPDLADRLLAEHPVDVVTSVLAWIERLPDDGRLDPMDVADLVAARQRFETIEANHLTE